MKKLNSYLILLALLSVGNAVGAERSIGSYPVSIPRSRIEMPKTIEPETPSAPDRLEFGASSWTPSSFNLPSEVQNATSFSRSGLPSLYINYLRPLSASYGFFLKAGLNWVSLSRDGKIGNTASAATESQSVSLASLRLGAEYAPSALQIKAAQPYLGLALLPTLGMTGRSAFDDGATYFGVPIEYSAGALFDLRRFGLNWNQAQLDLSLIGTAGTIEHSSFAGIGARGGIRVAL